MKNPWKSWAGLFDEKETPSTPHYDPVHLATVLVGCMVVIGALFWLLWTLFVYEGGLFVKIVALVAPQPNDHRVTFEGWQANVAALVLCAVVLRLLLKADRRASKRPR
ncbi:MAG: hypothetical protein KGL74_01620 [Elusimicrobia bacterium]|nr:hypothetical protein [Elusimicrobiota bacterium]